jgi:hypothetical protein
VTTAEPDHAPEAVLLAVEKQIGNGHLARTQRVDDAENIRRALDAELSFYAQVLGFTLPDEEHIEPVAVENL